MKRLFAIAAIASLVAGCAVQPIPTPIQRPAFPEAEYAALPRTGTASVTGQAFLKTRGGDVKTGAGSTIYLNPVTSYSKFAFENRYHRGGLSPIDPRLNQYMRQVVADATGRFTFKNVPDGLYYLAGSVTWEVASMGTQGGVMWKEVAVKNGESIEVMLTQ